MTSRVLPRDEWDRLSPEWPMLSQVNPEAITPVVVEDEDGQIVGAWGLITLAHVEGIWIREDHRAKGVVIRRLWRQMQALTTLKKIASVITGSDSDQVTELLMSLGAQPMPNQYLLSMEKKV
jgi:hypothetical protein